MARSGSRRSSRRCSNVQGRPIGSGGATAGPQRAFGATSLKTNGKIFAMLVNGRLVVKLDRKRVDSLVASGDGTNFDPGHGRLMKEWLDVESDSGRDVARPCNRIRSLRREAAYHKS